MYTYTSVDILAHVRVRKEVGYPPRLVSDRVTCVMFTQAEVADSLPEFKDFDARLAGAHPYKLPYDGQTLSVLWPYDEPKDVER